MVSAMTPLRRDVVPFGLVGRDPNVLLVSRCLQPVGVYVEHHCKPISAHHLPQANPPLHGR
jgi:hypothetical protein